jgi:hypothetical protein
MHGTGTYRDLLENICVVTYVDYENDTMYGFVRVELDRWLPATWDCAGGRKEGSAGANLVKLISNGVTGVAGETRKPWTFKEALTAIANAKDASLRVGGHNHKIISVGAAGLFVEYNTSAISYEELTQERFTFDKGKPCCNVKEEWV